MNKYKMLGLLAPHLQLSISALSKNVATSELKKYPYFCIKTISSRLKFGGDHKGTLGSRKVAGRLGDVRAASEIEVEDSKVVHVAVVDDVPGVPGGVGHPHSAVAEALLDAPFGRGWVLKSGGG